MIKPFRCTETINVNLFQICGWIYPNLRELARYFIRENSSTKMFLDEPSRKVTRYIVRLKLSDCGREIQIFLHFMMQSLWMNKAESLDKF